MFGPMLSCSVPMASHGSCNTRGRQFLLSHCLEAHGGVETTSVVVEGIGRANMLEADEGAVDQRALGPNERR